LAIGSTLDQGHAGSVANKIAGRTEDIDLTIADVDVGLARLVEVAGRSSQSSRGEVGIEIDEASHVLRRAAVDRYSGREDASASVLRVLLVLRLEEVKPGTDVAHPGVPPHDA